MHNAASLRHTWCMHRQCLLPQSPRTMQPKQHQHSAARLLAVDKLCSASASVKTNMTASIVLNPSQIAYNLIILDVILVHIGIVVLGHLKQNMYGVQRIE